MYVFIGNFDALLIQLLCAYFLTLVIAWCTRYPHSAVIVRWVIYFLIAVVLGHSLDIIFDLHSFNPTKDPIRNILLILMLARAQFVELWPSLATSGFRPIRRLARYIIYYLLAIAKLPPESKSRQGHCNADR